MSESIAQALNAVREIIGTATRQAGRPDGSVALVAVSKTFPAGAVREAWQAGQRAFGENYVQELQAKATELVNMGIEWHFIGPLQSNKTRSVAELAHWVHSVDRLKIAERLSAQRPAGLPPLNVLIQVNVSGELSKSGCRPDEVIELARAVTALPGLTLRGLMCIPEPSQDETVLLERFGVLAALRERLAAEGMVMDVLSMGMSSDLSLAIRAGATHVRVGTAIFGNRHYSSDPV